MRPTLTCLAIGVAKAATVVAVVVLFLWLFPPISPLARPIFDALGLPSPMPEIHERCTPPIGYTVCGSEYHKLFHCDP